MIRIPAGPLDNRREVRSMSEYAWRYQHAEGRGTYNRIPSCLPDDSQRPVNGYSVSSPAYFFEMLNNQVPLIHDGLHLSC
jgi:hypothetical protein